MLKERRPKERREQVAVDDAKVVSRAKTKGTGGFDERVVDSGAGTNGPLPEAGAASGGF